MCYERWSEIDEIARTQEQARKEAEKLIEQAKSAPRPAPASESQREKDPVPA